ncbi:MAG: hypothetical protein LBH01_08345 [Verrucomicrobiales bacterium]|jgi:hypothetical protein|nr:hypothetical protein [Verrucomicrobiales bacterium]
MKFNHSSRCITVLGLLAIVGAGSLQAAVVQTSKGERIATTPPQVQPASAPGERMTVANCPRTTTEQAKITYSKYSKDHDQVTRTGAVQRMTPCRQELTRQADKQTYNRMVGCN